MIFHCLVLNFSYYYYITLILSPVGESCVAIPRVGSLKGYSIRIHERVWDRERFIVTGSTFWPFFDQKMAKNVPNENAPIFLKIWSGVLWVGYRHLPKRENWSEFSTCHFNDPLGRGLWKPWRGARIWQNGDRGCPGCQKWRILMGHVWHFFGNPILGTPAVACPCNFWRAVGLGLSNLACFGFGARLVLVGWGGVDRIVVTPACLKFLRGPAVHGSIFNSKKM